MLGVVNLDKPVGPTSHDMVDLVRRLTGMRRIGHAGTLDPLASGVLPILVGAATRFSDDLTGGAKRYEAVIRLGIRSATDDAQGPLEVGSRRRPIWRRSAPALALFVGTFEQRPPAFSARKVDGRVAHRAARAGKPVEAAAAAGHGPFDRPARHRSAATGGSTCAATSAAARAPTSARSRATSASGSAAAATCTRCDAPRRRGSQVADGVTPDQLERLAAAGRLDEAILPIASLLRLPPLRLDAEAAGRFMHGSAVQVRGEHGAGRHAVFGDGELLGIGLLTDGLLEPRTVIAAQDPA